MQEQCQGHEQMVKSFEQFNENQKDIVTRLSDLREKVAVIDQSCRSAHHRVDSIHEQTQAIVKMSSSVEYMAKQVEETLKILKEHDGRINRLEHAPGEQVLSYWKIFIGALVAGGAGVVVGILV